MPRGSYEDRGREDRSYRKTVGRLSSQKHYSDNTLAIKAAVASGKMDTLLIIPTSALDSMVFDKRVDESDFGRVKKSPKALPSKSVRLYPLTTNPSETTLHNP